MATPNVIDCPAFSKPHLGSNSYLVPKPNQHRWFVREDEADYGKILNIPLWPQFPDGAYLKPLEASRFYRATQGIQGLVHLLNRSNHLRGLNKDYDGEIDRPLSEAQESKLWAALIEIGVELGRLADDLHRNSEDHTQ
jgi:hypothetical protein